jgi:23S rRNA (uracil1939-C5)-methyltransferase
MTRQLLPETVRAATTLADRLRAGGFAADADIEVSENRPGDQRAMHIEVVREAAPASVPPMGPVDGLTGLTWSAGDSGPAHGLIGQPYVEDVVRGVRLRRHVRAFFQGNRYLLDELVAAVTGACPPGPVIDLYAGVGLFGLCLAAGGGHQVVAVEGHDASAADLEANAAPLGEAVRVERTSVERFLARRHPRRPFTHVLDPPRTGMTREAAAGAIALKAARVVFVSCDVATLARDLDVHRALVARAVLRHFDVRVRREPARPEPVGQRGGGPHRLGQELPRHRRVAHLVRALEEEPGALTPQVQARSHPVARLR